MQLLTSNYTQLLPYSLALLEKKDLFFFSPPRLTATGPEERAPSCTRDGSDWTPGIISSMKGLSSLGKAALGGGRVTIPGIVQKNLNWMWHWVPLRQGCDLSQVGLNDPGGLFQPE